MWSIMYLFGWSKPTKGSKHALAAKLETVAHCMWRIVLISTDWHNSAPSLGLEKGTPQVLTLHLQPQINWDHLRSSQIPRKKEHANHLKSIEILAILRSRVVALASKSLCLLLSALQPLQEAKSPNSSWFQVCIVVPTSYIFCECLYWFSWFFQLPEYFTQTFGNQ